MALNVLNVLGETIGIGVGVLVLIIFCATFSPLVTRLRIPARRIEDMPPPSNTPELIPKKDQSMQDKIRAQDHVESFNGDVIQGRGAIPLIAAVFSIGLLIWWVVYLVLNWSQYLWSVRDFWR